MTIKPEKADDDIDALEALASEEKEFVKVRSASPPPPSTHHTNTVHNYRMQKLIEF